MYSFPDLEPVCGFMSSNLWFVIEAIVRTRHRTTEWFQIGKDVHESCILSPCLFSFYAEYIMQNARLDEAQAGIKIAGRNINNLRYAGDTTLMAESKEELSMSGFIMNFLLRTSILDVPVELYSSLWFLVHIKSTGDLVNLYFCYAVLIYSIAFIFLSFHLSADIAYLFL